MHSIENPLKTHLVQNQFENFDTLFIPRHVFIQVGYLQTLNPLSFEHFDSKL
jgi:hypothetical protein